MAYRRIAELEAEIALLERIIKRLQDERNRIYSEQLPTTTNRRPRDERA